MNLKVLGIVVAVVIAGLALAYYTGNMPGVEYPVTDNLTPIGEKN